jgi:hypothetical protein
VRVQEAARGGLSPRQIEERLRVSISEVEELALPLFGPADSAIVRYAREAFREANA